MQQQELKLTELRERHSKLVTLQSTQYEKMRGEIEAMVCKLENQREENRLLRLEHFEQGDVADRIVSLVSKQRDAFARYLHRSQETSSQQASPIRDRRDPPTQEGQLLARVQALQDDLLFETGRMRARLSAGRTKGVSSS